MLFLSNSPLLLQTVIEAVTEADDIDMDKNMARYILFNKCWPYLFHQKRLILFLQCSYYDKNQLWKNGIYCK